MVDANGNAVEFVYDERDLVLSEIRPLEAIRHYRYDDMGDRVREQDPEGRITEWTYDLRRRSETETRAATGDDPETTTFGYDGNGNLTSKQLGGSASVTKRNPPIQRAAGSR